MKFSFCDIAWTLMFLCVSTWHGADEGERGCADMCGGPAIGRRLHQYPREHCAVAARFRARRHLRGSTPSHSGTRTRLEKPVERRSGQGRSAKCSAARGGKRVVCVCFAAVHARRLSRGARGRGVSLRLVLPRCSGGPGGADGRALFVIARARCIVPGSRSRTGRWCRYVMQRPPNPSSRPSTPL